MDPLNIVVGAIASFLLEIGMMEVQHREEDIEKVRRNVMLETGREEQLKDELIDLHLPIYGGGYSRDRLENKSIKELKHLHNMLFNQDPVDIP